MSSTSLVKSNTNTLKVVFGLAIFAFSLAFAYFLASYTDRHNFFDYWGTLLILAGVYILVGVVVVNIFPVSLGFLFSADVLILNALVENFGDLNPSVKAFFVGAILAVLYLVAWLMFPDSDVPAPPTPPAPPEPAVASAPAPESREQSRPVSLDTATIDLDLNERLQQVDISGAKQVTFYPKNGQAFSTSEPAILRIALYTLRAFGKSTFTPGELSQYFASFISSYQPTLPEGKVKVVVNKMNDFVASGGKFEVT